MPQDAGVAIPKPKAKAIGAVCLAVQSRGLRAYRIAWLPETRSPAYTLGRLAIPVSLAYASLAGLPPQYGIYCYLVAGRRTRCSALAPARDRTDVGDFDAGRRHAARHGARAIRSDGRRSQRSPRLIFAVMSIAAWVLASRRS
jgi:hypothetical protein